MSNCNIFASFGKGFLAGAGYSLGAGLCNIAQSAMWSINMQFPPLFTPFFGAFSFSPSNCCFGNNLYTYNIPMPNITLPQANISVFDNSNSSIGTPTTQFTPLPQFDIPVLQGLNIDTITFGSTAVQTKTSTASTPAKTQTASTPAKTQTSSKYSNNNGSHIYASLNKSEAEARAKKNSNLEELTGGDGWTVSSGSFVHDIKYAKKGTGALLSKASEMVGQQLTVTSALGTELSPHDKTIKGSASHYNESNPKLDLGGGMSHEQAEALKNKLMTTGLFSRVVVENDGSTSHLDVQFTESAYEAV